MLDTRYIHLHEALGLGAMWLNHHAKIIRQNAPIIPPIAPTVAPKSVQAATPITPKKPPPNVKITPPTDARQATLQRVRAYQNQDAQNISGSLKQSIPVLPTVAPQIHASAKILAMSVCASLPDIVAGKLFSGEDGVLLRKMYTAIHLSDADVALTTWLKDLPDFTPQPAPEIVQAATQRVAQEWQNSGAKAMLLLGDFFLRDDVIAELNQFSNSNQRFTTHHPLRILHNPNLKRSAWETLQQLQKFLV